MERLVVVLLFMASSSMAQMGRTREWSEPTGQVPDRQIISARLHLTPLDGLAFMWNSLESFSHLKCLLSHTHLIVHIEADPATQRPQIYRTYEFHPYIPPTLKKIAKVLLRDVNDRFKPDTISRQLLALPQAMWIMLTPALPKELLIYLWGDGHVDFTDSPEWEPLHRRGRLSDYRESPILSNRTLASVDEFNMRWGRAYDISTRNCHMYTVTLMTFLTGEDYGPRFLHHIINTGWLILFLLVGVMGTFALSTVAVLSFAEKMVFKARRQYYRAKHMRLRKAREQRERNQPITREISVEDPKSPVSSASQLPPKAQPRATVAKLASAFVDPKRKAE